MSHEHDHQHAHTHGHDHGPGHDHSHQHSNAHTHDHNHGHDHNHAHDHDHGHEHDQAHGHAHEHHDSSAPAQTIPDEAFFIEALALLGEGVAAVRVESAARSIGRPQGVFAELDVLGLERFDQALHHELAVRKRAAASGHSEAAAVRFPSAAAYVIEKMAHGFRRTGQAAGGGFYEYSAGQVARLWSGLNVFERGGRAIEDSAIAKRLQRALEGPAQ